MIWHPFTWAFWAAVVTGGLFYGAAAVGAVDVVLSWCPARGDMDQLQRERRAETAAILARGSLGCLAAAALLGLIGIAVVWHHGVPGAMCGTGVLQAMGRPGSRALMFWGAALLILYGWRVLDRLDRHQPQGMLIRTSARVMLLAAPFLALAVFCTWLAVMRVATVPAVSCCAAIYDPVVNSNGPSIVAGSMLTWSSLAAAAALLILTMLGIRFSHWEFGPLPAVIAVCWAVTATNAVKHVWAAYYYQVLSHPCPWCLFLPDYHGVGFFIFGCMAVVIMEGIAFWLAGRTRRQYPLLAAPAEKRRCRAARRMMIALIGFTLLTAGPAVAWRLGNGVWLGDWP